MASSEALTAAANVEPSTVDASSTGSASSRPKLGWKGAVEKLAKTGALGASKQWSTVLDDIRATTKDLDSYDVALRKHTYAASFGKAPLKHPPMSAGPKVHSYSGMGSTLRSTVATFGKAPIEHPPISAGPKVHSYSGMGSTFTPKMGATFGRAKTGRGDPPKTACSVHSYSSIPPATPLTRKSPVRGTFGTAPARPASIVMTRTGLLLSTGKPASLPPLTPLRSKARSTTNALGFASKLKRAVSSAENLQSGPADILIIDRTPSSTAALDSGAPHPDALDSEGAAPAAEAPALEASVTRLSEEYQRKVGRLAGDATPPELGLKEGSLPNLLTEADAAALARELLDAKETVSPVKRKLSMLEPLLRPEAVLEPIVA